MSRVLAASVPHRAVVPQRRPPGYTRRRLAKPARAAADGTTSTDDASTSMKPSRKGKVFLIGAGPGGIDHLTVRALRLLRACDVVLHDALGASDASLLDEAPPSARSRPKTVGLPWYWLAVALLLLFLLGLGTLGLR